MIEKLCLGMIGHRRKVGWKFDRWTQFGYFNCFNSFLAKVVS